MSLLPKLFAGAMGLIGFLPGPFISQAQDFGLGVTVSPNPVVVNNPVLFTIAVTNTFGFSLTDVYVTNAFPPATIVQGATNYLLGPIYTTQDGIVFQISTLPGGVVAQLTLSLIPVATGPFTNQITVAAFNRISAITNAIASVILPSADLAIGMTNAVSGVVMNDSTAIELVVTNFGPSAASGVVISNHLPTSFKLLSVVPAGLDYTYENGNLAVNLGVLARGDSARLQVFVQPTNAGDFTFVASVAATNVLDSNPTNNAVTNAMTVGSVIAADLVATVLTQSLNRQTGLLEMNVMLANHGTTNVPAARLFVTGLTNGAWLYNAVGTNSGDVYVLYNAPLAGGASVNLLLEYYVLTRAPITGFQFLAVGVPAINLNAPTNSGTAISKYELSSGGFLIEFPAVPGGSYLVVYSDNLAFSNALTAQPPIVAPANQVQWIDNGPPKTLTHPSNTVTRFYRVLPVQ